MRPFEIRITSKGDFFAAVRRFELRNIAEVICGHDPYDRPENPTHEKGVSKK